MTPQVQALLAAVPALQDLVPAELPGPEALEDCRGLLVAVQQLQSVLTRRLADVHTRGLHELESARSMGAWVGRQPAPPAPALVTLARALSGLGHLQDSLLGDRLSGEAATAVAAAVRRARPFLDRPDGLVDGVCGEAALGNVVLRGVLEVLGREHGGSLGTEDQREQLVGRLLAVHDSPTGQADRLEQAFVVAAEHLPARRVAPALALLLDALLPQQLADRTDDAQECRQLDLRHEQGGGWSLTAHLDEVTGEMLRTALAAMQAVDPDNPVDTAAWAAQQELGALSDPVAPVPPAPRSRRQQRHDALHLLLDRALGGGLLGERDKVVPHVVVTIGVDALHGVPGALPAVTDGVVTWPAALVRRTLCDSRLTRVVLDLESRPLDISHTERTLRPHERRTLLTQWDGRCGSTTCSRPRGTPLIPHHVERYATCGTTSSTDSVPFCLADHSELHRGATLLLRNGRLLTEQGYVAA